VNGNSCSPQDQAGIRKERSILYGGVDEEYLNKERDREELIGGRRSQSVSCERGT